MLPSFDDIELTLDPTGFTASVTTRNRAAAVRAERCTQADRGAGSRKPRVILLHASGSSARQWRLLQQRFASGIDAPAIDLYGHGRRAAWAGPGSMRLADEAQLVLPLLEGAEGGVHLVGHSYGAAVALKVAAMCPAAVRSVLAYEPVLFAMLASDRGAEAEWRHVRRTALAIIAQVEQGNLEGAARAFFESWSGPGAWASASALSRAAMLAAAPQLPAQFDALIAEERLAEALAVARVPVHLLVGENSVPAMRRIAATLARALPNVRHEVVPGAGHLGPITHFEEVSSRIERHLSAWLATAEPAAAGLGDGFARLEVSAAQGAV